VKLFYTFRQDFQRGSVIVERTPGGYLVSLWMNPEGDTWCNSRYYIFQGDLGGAVVPDSAGALALATGILTGTIRAERLS